MTRKDYDLIAGILAKRYRVMPNAIEMIAYDMEQIFMRDPKFQPWIFHSIIINEVMTLKDAS